MRTKVLTPWLICLAPSALLLILIGLGAAVGLPMFRLTWDNYFLFSLLSIAVICPLSKIPLLSPQVQLSACFTCEGMPADADALVGERQAVIMRTRLERLNQPLA